MAHLNHRGPEEKGSKTGRKLGLCSKEPGEKPDFQLGEGMGLKRKSENSHCSGKGKRLNAFYKKQQ